MTATPETTAVVVSHNHARFISQCLESIRDQTVPPTLLILIDDGSSDDSFAIGSTFVEHHFPHHQLIRHQEPVGLCKSLNEALSLSRGEFLHTIAADDYWLAQKTETQLMAFAAASDDAAVVFGDAVLVDEDGQPTGGTFLEHFAPAGLPPEDEMFTALLRRNFLPGMAMLVRRAALLEAGGWDEALFYEDWDMWLRLAGQGRFVHQDEVVAAYRYLPTSMSNARADEMWLSKIVIAGKWAGRSLRADVGWLGRTLPVTARHAAHGDLRYARAWWRLLGCAVARRLRRLISQKPST